MKRYFTATLLLIFYAISNSIFAQKNVQARIDSLEIVLKSSAKDTSKINILLNLCSAYQQTDPNKVNLYLKEATELANELKVNKWIAECIYTQGLYEYGKGNFSAAKKKYQEAQALFEKEKNQLRAATMIYNIGILEVYTGNYVKANENFFKTLHIYEFLGKKDNISNCYTAIGNVYGRQGNKEKEIEFHRKSLALRLQQKDKYGISASYINIGNAYGRKQQYDTALSYYFKGLKIAEEIKNQKWILNSLGNIGTIYSQQKKHKEALQYLSKGLDMAENIGDKKSLCTFLNTIGQCYSDMNDNTNAKAYIERALLIGKQTGNKEEMQTSYSNLAQVNERMGDYHEAYQNHILYSNMKDSILNEENSAQINEMQAKYDSEKQEQKIELLNKDNEIQTAHSKQQQIIIWSIGAGLMLAVILAFFIFRQFREKQKANVALQSAYVEIEVKNKNITDSINYARRIQTAILPSLEHIQQYLPDTFIFYRPKDIVSGDFYWFTEKESYCFVVVADCTGHGVPGAFMSMIGNDMLTQIIIEKGILQPNLILTHLHEAVKNALKQDAGQSDSKDGMDISIIRYRPGSESLDFSGALRPLWWIKKNAHTVTEIKPDKHSIGGSYSNDQRQFTNHTIAVTKGDLFYMSTDGYADQFGGEQGKKMMTKNMKGLVESIQTKTMSEQKTILENNFQSWKIEREQVDDVLVFGVRV